MPNKTYFSWGDLLDLYHLARIHGINFLFKHFKFFSQGRAKGKWTRIDCSDSDFWILEQVHQRWNKMISGNEQTIYEQYVCNKYLNQKSNLHLLSIGCGNSSHEQNFSKQACFNQIDGIDFSEKQVLKARQYAQQDGCNNINYFVHDFEKQPIKNKKYDVVLFHSSLHHFSNIDFILKERVLPILNPNALLVLWEYTGPNRLQWTNTQLQHINQLLHQMPTAYKILKVKSKIKKKVYRPGLLRMYLSDPTEAVQSQTLLKSVHQYFEVLEEKKLGCNLVHPLLKGISQHFTQNTKESNKLLNELFEQDNLFVAQHQQSDFTFGVYRQK